MEVQRKRLEMLLEQWAEDEKSYPTTDNGRMASAAVRACMRELRAAMDGQ